jgi:hypothetical protein
MERELIVAAIEEVGVLKERLEGLLTAFDSEKRKEDEQPLKQRNGRLTEAGIRKLRQMIDAGRSDWTIATTVGITQPAVLNQRK